MWKLDNFHLVWRLMFSVLFFMLIKSCHKTPIDPFSLLIYHQKHESLLVFQVRKVGHGNNYCLSLDERFSLERYPISHSYCCLTNFFFSSTTIFAHTLPVYFSLTHCWQQIKKLGKILTHTRWRWREELNKIYGTHSSLVDDNFIIVIDLFSLYFEAKIWFSLQS